MKVYAPARVWGMTRADEIDYARARGIRVPVTKGSPYSTDENLWGRSIECGILEDPWQEAPEDAYTLTRSGADCPDLPAYLEADLRGGVPVEVNGVSMPLTELIHSVATIAGVHGVGRIDMVENRLVGIKSRESVRGARRRRAARRRTGNWSRVVTPKRPGPPEAGTGRQSTPTWSTTASGSRPMRQAIDAFVATMQPQVTGQVRLRLFKGECRVVGRRSPYALYDRSLATYEKGDAFDHAAAEGFIKCGACRSRPWPASRHGCGVRRLPRERLRAASPGVRARRVRSAIVQTGLVCNMSNLWSGRFAGIRREVFEFGRSFAFDRRLFEDDVRGSLAWVEAIAAAGAIAPRDAAAIADGLRGVLAEGTSATRLRRGRRRGRARVRRAQARRTHRRGRQAAAHRAGRATSRSRSTSGST